MIVNDYYKVLGVSPKASIGELRKAYRALARQYHPDTAKGEEAEKMFTLVSEAYGVLSDPAKRNQYNKENGYPYFEDIDLGGNISPELYDEDIATERKRAAEQEAAEKKRTKPEIRSGVSFDSLKGKLGEHDLKVGHKVALTSEEELERINSEEDEGVGAWGDEDETAEQGVSRGGKGILSIFKKKNDQEEKRAFLKDELRRKLDEEMHPMTPTQIERPRMPEQFNEPERASNGFHSPLQGDRKFRFQISAFEQAIGTTREVALAGRAGQEPRRIKVEIPPGTPHGSLIEAAQGWERVQAEISVVQDKFLRVHDADILLRFPLTLGEAARRQELRVPIVGASMVVKMAIPSATLSYIRIEGKGLEQTGREVLADMLLFPMVALPKTISPLVQAAIDTISAEYKTAVRDEFEKDSGSEKFFFPDGDSGVLLLPMSLSEAIEGFSVEVNLKGRQIPITVPAKWNVGAEISMQGALVDEEGTVGDLMVYPYLALPQSLSPEALGAAESVEAAYTSAVRAELPGRLPSPNS